MHDSGAVLKQEIFPQSGHPVKYRITLYFFEKETNILYDLLANYSVSLALYYFQHASLKNPQSSKSSAQKLRNARYKVICTCLNNPNLLDIFIMISLKLEDLILFFPTCPWPHSVDG